MFYCQITGRLSKPGEKLNKLVLETRDRIYTRQVKNEDTREWETIEIGRGWEIVREVSATEEGVKEWNEMTPEERDSFLSALKTL